MKEFELLYKAQKLLDNHGVNWCFCGGWAIELLAGKVTRPHKDIDISILNEDKYKAVDFMLESNWKLVAPKRNGFDIIQSSGELREEHHNVWCIDQSQNSNFVKERVDHNGNKHFAIERKQQEQLDFIELLFDVEEDGYIYFRRDHSILLEKHKAVLERDGLLYLAPELVLLYKSKYIDEISSHDFMTAIGYMSEEQKDWLLRALVQLYDNEHPWLLYFEVF